MADISGSRKAIQQWCHGINKWTNNDTSRSLHSTERGTDYQAIGLPVGCWLTRKSCIEIYTF